MSGPYRDTGGPLSVACTRQAAKEFGNQGFAVEVVNADHQNKPDLGASIARRWIDEDGVDVILDVPTSSVALAVNSVVRGEEQGLPELGRRHRGPHRVAMLAEHGALDLRRVHARQEHRRRHGEGGRR